MLVLKPIATFSLHRQQACERQRAIRWHRLVNGTNVPYTVWRKLSREKTFAFRYKTRISRRKLPRIAQVQLLCRCGPRACATHPHTRNVRIADCKISRRKLSRVVLKPRKTPVLSFPLYGINISMNVRITNTYCPAYLHITQYK